MAPPFINPLRGETSGNGRIHRKIGNGPNHSSARGPSRACSVPADADVVQPPAVAEGELAVGVDPVSADPVVAIAGPVLDELVGERREVQRIPRRASVVVRAGIKGGA